MLPRLYSYIPTLGFGDEKLSKETSFAADIRREQVRLVFLHLPTMLLASFFVALVLAYMVRDVAALTSIVIWLTLIVAVAVSRIVLYFQFLKVRETCFPGERWGAGFLLLALCSGIAWGLSAFLIYPANNLGLISLFVLVMASLSAATTVSHSSIRFASPAWVVPAMVLYAIRSVLGRGEPHYLLGALIVIYLFTVLSYSFTHNKAITAALLLKFENLELLAEVQRANALLNQDIAERKKAEGERTKLIGDLTEALSKVKTLSGLLPICASCKKIRDDAGYWNQIEAFLRSHAEVEFSHGICPDCFETLYQEFND